MLTLKEINDRANLYFWGFTNTEIKQMELNNANPIRPCAEGNPDIPWEPEFPYLIKKTNQE